MRLSASRGRSTLSLRNAVRQVRTLRMRRSTAPVEAEREGGDGRVPLELVVRWSCYHRYLLFERASYALRSCQSLQLRSAGQEHHWLLGLDSPRTECIWSLFTIKEEKRYREENLWASCSLLMLPLLLCLLRVRKESFYSSSICGGLHYHLFDLEPTLYRSVPNEPSSKLLLLGQIDGT